MTTQIVTCLLIGVLFNVSEGKGMPSNCNPQKKQQEVEACMKNAGTNPTQISACLATKSDACALDTKQIEMAKSRFAQEQMQRCIYKITTGTKTKSQCEADFKTLTGKDPPKPRGNAQQQANEQERAKNKGLKQSIGEAFSTCANASSNATSRTACLNAAVTSFKAGFATAPSDVEAKRAIGDLGLEIAGKLVTDCINAAADDTAKNACFSNSDAKKMLATARGILPTAVTADDLKRASSASARKQMTEMIEACRKNAADAVAKKDCVKTDTMRSYIANGKGKGNGDVKGSEIQKALREGQRDMVKEAAESCKFDETNAATKRASVTACEDELMNVLSDAGKAAVTRFDVQNMIKDAQTSSMSTLMKDCMTDAGADAAKIAACRKQWQDAMRKLNPRGEAPTNKEMKEMEKRSAQRAVLNLGCTDTKSKACMDKFTAEAAKAMGKAFITDAKARELRQKGAMQSAGDEARACQAAQKDDSTATCANLFDTYLQTNGKAKNSDPKKAKAEEMKFFSKMARDQMSKAKKLCIVDAKTNKTAFDICRTQAQTQMDEFFDFALRNISSGKRAQRKQAAMFDADKKAFADDFIDCMEAAFNETTNVTDVTVQQACKDDLTTALTAANIGVSAKEIMAVARRIQIKQIMEACKDLTGSDKATCIKEATEAAMKLGMKKRQFRMFKRMGNIKSGAEHWSGCKDTNLTDAECDTQAKEKFNELIGKSSTDAVPTKVMAKITYLGKQLYSGINLQEKFLKKVRASFVTDGAACSSATEAKAVAKVNAVINKAGALSEGCNVEDGKAVYEIIMDMDGKSDTEITTAADSISTNVGAGSSLQRRLSGQERHLASVQESYASQDVQECAQGDTACGSGSTATGSTALTTISGSLTLTTNNCAGLQSTNGKAALAQAIAKIAGGLASNTVVTVACARRLADGRKLTTQTASVGYIINVPASSTVTAATMTSNLKAATAATFQSEIQTALASKSITASVTVTNLGTVTSQNSQSDLANLGSMSAGCIAIFALMVSLAPGQDA